jgi:hypothetical protein
MADSLLVAVEVATGDRQQAPAGVAIGAAVASADGVASPGVAIGFVAETGVGGAPGADGDDVDGGDTGGDTAGGPDEHAASVASRPTRIGTRTRRPITSPSIHPTPRSGTPPRDPACPGDRLVD